MANECFSPRARPFLGTAAREATRGILSGRSKKQRFVRARCQRCCRATRFSSVTCSSVTAAVRANALCFWEEPGWQVAVATQLLSPPLTTQPFEFLFFTKLSRKSPTRFREDPLLFGTDARDTTRRFPSGRPKEVRLVARRTRSLPWSPPRFVSH